MCKGVVFCTLLPKNLTFYFPVKMKDKHLTDICLTCLVITRCSCQVMSTKRDIKLCLSQKHAIRAAQHIYVQYTYHTHNCPICKKLHWVNHPFTLCTTIYLGILTSLDGQHQVSVSSKKSTEVSLNKTMSLEWKYWLRSTLAANQNLKRH